MDDAFIMSTAFLDSLTPPFIGSGRGQFARVLASPPAYCRCGGPLIEHDFPKHVVLTCDKAGCPLFRRPQGIRTKETRLETAPVPGVSRMRTERYESYKEQKKCNYRILRELGVPSSEASFVAGSNKKVERIVRMGGIQLTFANNSGEE